MMLIFYSTLLDIRYMTNAILHLIGILIESLDCLFRCGMRKLIGLVLVMLLFAAVAQSKSIYLIRHAEKLDDGSKNPVLTIKGQQRAQNLSGILSHAGITQVYATDYHRTQMTAKPLADYLGIEVTLYNPSKLQAFAEQMKVQDESVLIVGHSNTTPELTHLISGKPVIKLEESDFDYIFQVVIKGGQTTLNVLKSLPVQSPE